jgi:hypothetical protein
VGLFQRDLFGFIPAATTAAAGKRFPGAKIAVLEEELGPVGFSFPPGFGQWNTGRIFSLRKAAKGKEIAGRFVRLEQ